MKGPLLPAMVTLVLLYSKGEARIFDKNNLEEKGDIYGDINETGDLWAVLVAGSSGWYNYRHQADVCHAYQILHQHGVPDDHIIVMMYDDISENEQNPNPGVIINRPNGPNVYEGVLKDYTGEDVTPENFLNILKGNGTAMAGIGSGKVINSTHKDRIFINLVDHGAPGIFAFPEKVLHATRLAKTVNHLHRKRRFSEMVIYVEACESGSMFKDLLPDDVKVYALSASNPHQPSYACYMDEELDTYLGDVFSVKWMEDTDRENIHHETLSHQFHLVHQEVTTSKVMQWGDRRINKQRLWKFMGEKDDPQSYYFRYTDASNITYPEPNSIYALDDKHHQIYDAPQSPQNEVLEKRSRYDSGENSHVDEKSNSTKHTAIPVIEAIDADNDVDEKKNSTKLITISKKEDIIDADNVIGIKTEEDIRMIEVNKTTTGVNDTDISSHEISNDDDQYVKENDRDDPCINSAVASPEVPVAILKSRIAKSNGTEEEHWKRQLTSLYLKRMLVHSVVKTLVSEVTKNDTEVHRLLDKGDVTITQWECYDRSVDTFHDLCFNLGQNPYALRLLKIFVNVCESGYNHEAILKAAKSVCQLTPFTDIH